MAGPDLRAQIDDLLMHALELEDQARARFVEAIEPPSLRASVLELLHLCDLDTAPLELDPAAVAGLIEAAAGHLPGNFDSAPGFSLGPQTLPDHIGAWRVLDRIGAGGMGEVLKVERKAGDFEQLGALKLIRSGFAVGDFTRRFLQERQILARLGHPGIAGLLDGGTDAQGHPYLVMEYVDGEPIDQHCDARRLSLEARIDLFVEVCRALAHAHRNLVVHRDLKPSNILVRADGQVKLLDFGIAKVLGGEQDSEVLATRIEQRLFTPEYASPEQVRGLPITTASDVYQLGLLLYELLCGKRAQVLGKAGPAAIEHSICENELPRLSQRVDEANPELAARRGLQPRQLKRRLRGDIDTIVGKALQKQPERRYGTVDELIDDLARSRSGHSLRARPDTLPYRFARFARRHPLGLGFALVTVMLFALYLITLSLQAQALQRERDRAQAEASKARQVQTLVQRLFEGIDPDVSGGEPLSVQALLDRSFAQIEGELGEHPEVQAELLLTVGDVYQALGNYPRAGELLEQAQALAEALEAEQPLLAARVYRSRGRLLGQGNALEEPEALLQRALGLFRAAQPEQPLQAAETLFQMAELMRRQDRGAEALMVSQQALQLRRAAAQDNPIEIAASLSQVVMIERSQGRSERAESMLRESLLLLSSQLAAVHPRIAETRANLAMVLRAAGKPQLAIPLYLQALEALKASRGEYHPSVGIVAGNYGSALAELGRYREAELAHRQALDIHRHSFGDRHARVALALNALGFSLQHQERVDEAEAAFAAALDALPDTHADWARALAQNRGVALLKLGRHAEALAVLSQAEASAADASSLQQAILNRWRAEALLLSGQTGLAEVVASESIRLFADQSITRVELADAHRIRGASLAALGRSSEAISELETALASYETSRAASAQNIESTRTQLDRLRGRPAN